MTQHTFRQAASAARETKSAAKWPKILLGIVLIALCGVVRYYWGSSPANANPSHRTDQSADLSDRSSRSSDVGEQARDSEPTGRRSPKTRDRSDESIPEVVATVNTRRITREDLGRDCLRHFGKEVLESMVNKRLIMLECQHRGVKVTRHEVNAEIEEMADKFKIPVDQWLKMLKQERHVSPEQYAEDIIWPTIALRKLAGKQIRVSENEIRAEYETQYGEQIKVRLISSSSLEKAKQLRAKAAANPDDFGNLAKQYSEDAASAAVKGVINPIRRHGSYEEIEDAVFNINNGEITPVIHAGGQYVILQRVEVIPPKDVAYKDVADKLHGFLRDRKMRAIAQDVFRVLQEQAKQQDAIQNVWNDPAKRRKMPGVAATVYDDQITIRELAEQCIARHGREVLEGTINRTLIELECKKQGVAVSEDDIDREIERMAAAGAKTKSDGSPDVKAWLALIAKQGITLDVYRHDAVWPTVAMKKLVADKVKVSDEDLQKGFEANYGERVRCLAIVLNDQRRAQDIFEKARRHNTSEDFGRLAAQYSVEPGSQALLGEVPPIRKNGGQPELEKAAFELHPGELSGIISVEDKFIILRCEGRTKPVVTNFADVRDEIYNDLHEKMLQVAMTERFEAMQEAAAIDNYLANTSHSPTLSKRPSTAQLPTLRQLPSRQ
jgi:parvulin-like peptidyl-prolyl isomerase